jgi:hypothetical protein
MERAAVEDVMERPAVEDVMERAAVEDERVAVEDDLRETALSRMLDDMLDCNCIERKLQFLEENDEEALGRRYTLREGRLVRLLKLEIQVGPR